MLFWNARARNTHVEATLNHPCAAQVEPLRLGFDLDPPRASFIWFMDYICDGFFVADFGLNFRTGYLRRDTGALDMDPKRSAPGQDKRAKFPTSKPHISAVFHSFWLIFGRAIISWDSLEARMLFFGTRARGTLLLNRT